jgi:polysaccharide deacetylase 2 family uncharacterized protein YibQ
VRQLVCLLAWLAAGSAYAGSQQPLTPFDAPQIAIIIDDLGNRLHDGKRVILLPGQVTVSIIPYTPFAKRLALLAQINKKETMLHLPMESVDERYLGRGGLDESMDEAKFNETLYETLDAVPDIRGVNNHMGSRLTADATRMNWLMAGLLRHGELYFIDSRTTRLTQADTVAREYGLEHASRDVFLDDDTHEPQLQKQWEYLLRLARRKGSAIAIGHPYPETIQFLQQRLPTLAKQGINLVPVSELLQWRQTRRSLAWQTQPSSSPLPKAAKNSKPSPSLICCAAPASP